LKEREHSEDIGADGKIILKIYKLGCDIVEWILLAQDVGRLRAVLNAVMNFLTAQNAGNCLKI